MSVSDPSTPTSGRVRLISLTRPRLQLTSRDGPSEMGEPPVTLPTVSDSAVMVLREVWEVEGSNPGRDAFRTETVCYALRLLLDPWGVTACPVLLSPSSCTCHPVSVTLYPSPCTRHPVPVTLYP